ncbi:MAG: hypothetical protein A3G39_00675 [Deltaproteobacteria bacterium RIFCSPLOWO2_12_FULL_43_16]|nr:MAG: hypothetical protein A2Z89_09605 [Deltaproteobacteria bacterium GWA2_43_19]OGQ13064.1 MAG: hypothetical protein A3D30_07075 [Deltaproteobacteria bacterium RIFCSPHIGHO2_02_FULL_43_33]OGQ59716.1 MAG: hypothetical protein A3G39_00675 [Deltaproteobacteria bacterium RIFCSPLOWO2_12_FULL_43_16]HBR17531.1 hypothetical protein [Deltaproteobacteria bacterium]
MKLEYNAKILPDGHLPLPDKIKERLHLKSDDMIKVIVAKEYAGKPSAKFLATFGSWDDKRTPEEIIADIYGSRKSRGIGISL